MREKLLSEFKKLDLESTKSGVAWMMSTSVIVDLEKAVGLESSASPVASPLASPRPSTPASASDSESDGYVDVSKKKKKKEASPKFFSKSLKVADGSSSPVGFKKDRKGGVRKSQSPRSPRQ